MCGEDVLRWVVLSMCGEDVLLMCGEDMWCCRCVLLLVWSVVDVGC